MAAMRVAVRSLILFVALVPVLTSLNAWPGVEGLLVRGAAATYTSAESAAVQLGRGEPSTCHAGTACSGVPLPGATAFALVAAVLAVVAAAFVRGARGAVVSGPHARAVSPALLPPRSLPRC